MNALLKNGRRGRWIALALCLVGGAIPPIHAQSLASEVSVSAELAMSQGLLAWRPAAPGGLGPSINVPQLKVFDEQGRLVFHGNAAAAQQWLASKEASAPVAAQVRVRGLATERRLLKLPPAAPGAPFAMLYISEPCPPCAELWAGLKGPLLARLGAKAQVHVVRVGESLAAPR